MPATNIVSASDLRRLTHGSYEHKIARNRDVILEGVAQESGSSPADLSILSTYDECAVVVGENGKFWRVHLEAADSGDVHVVRITEEPVDALDVTNVGAALENGADRAVKAFMRGDLDAVKEQLSQLVSLTPSTSEEDGQAAISTLDSVFSSGRAWKRIYEERKSQIDRFVVNDLESLEADRLHPKFSKLYDGTLEESEYSNYAELVEEDLALVQRRYQNLFEGTDALVDAAQAGIVKAREGGGAVVEIFEAFASDLLEDLQLIVKQSGRAAQKVTTIGGRGKLRDTLVEGLHTYEVAGRFVHEVAGRLAQAA